MKHELTYFLKIQRVATNLKNMLKHPLTANFLCEAD